MTLCRRQIIQISALSAFDCSVVDYSGSDGFGELGFGSGEGALEMAPTSKEGSRRVNYPIVIHGGSDQ